MLKFYDNAIFRQYFVVVTVNLCVLATGASTMWPSPVLVKLTNSTQDILPTPITENQGSWVVSIGGLLGILANFLIPFLGETMGRKYGVILSCLPRIVASIFFICATDVWMILLGRAITGISDNGIFTLVPMYASEMASTDIRGSLGSIIQILCSLGVVIMLTMGPFVSYIALNVALLCIVVVTTLPLFFLPDSPYSLYSKGRKDEALKVLLRYRCSESEAHMELNLYEAENAKDHCIKKRDILTDKLFLKSLILNIILGLGTQFVGYTAVVFYLQTILESTQTSVNSEIASVIIGLIQLTASFGTTFMTDRFGRKPILTVTCLGMTLGMFGLGMFFKVKESGPVVGFMNYLPLASLIIIVYSYGAGFGSLFYVVSTELFPDKSRSLGMSITLIIQTGAIFVTTKYFATLISSIGPAYTYWGFSIICVLICLFIMFFIPETKGKSFAEIQNIFRNKKDKDDIKC